MGATWSHVARRSHGELARACLLSITALDMKSQGTTSVRTGKGLGVKASTVLLSPARGSSAALTTVTDLLFQGPSMQYPRFKIKSVFPNTVRESRVQRKRTSFGATPCSPCSTVLSCVLLGKLLNFPQVPFLHLSEPGLKKGQECKTPEATEV